MEPEDDWEATIRRVIESESSFPEIGRAARATVLDRYSFEANREAYLDFVRRAAATADPRRAG